jgi:NAD(P)H-hydrate epimerase
VANHFGFSSDNCNSFEKKAMINVSTVAEKKNLERRAAEQFGLTPELLMENAGRAAYQAISQHVGIKNKRFLVFCGTNSTGGSGLALARHIYSSEEHVKVFVFDDPANFSDGAKFHLDLISRLPIEIKQVQSLQTIQTSVYHSDIMIDALLGPEVSQPVEGLYWDAIELFKKSSKTIISLNIPSGVNGDTGQVMATAVKAEQTIIFGLPTCGALLFPGYELGGNLSLSYLSLPPEIYDDDALKIAINDSPALPPREIIGHKGTFGDVLFIAGAANYFGAPYFAALSFMKAGGGYSRLAAPKSITPFIANKGSEIVFLPQQETASGSLALANKSALLEWAEKVDMVVLGPGLSLNEETQQLVRELTQAIPVPLLIDGDGLTAIAQDSSILNTRTAETILTPHLGEMARITGRSVHDINADKIGIVQQTAKDLHTVIVLKGAHSLIGYPDGRVFINMSGNSGMATAGSGDVLTGTIAAMSGLGLPIPEAVRKGVFIHGLAGDLAAADKGEDGITAQDILEYLSRAVKCDREGLPEELCRRYAGIQII